MYTSEEAIAKAAYSVVERVREIAPIQTFRSLVEQARNDPEAVAQIAMALAVWVNPNEPQYFVDERVREIATSRVKVVLSA